MCFGGSAPSDMDAGPSQDAGPVAGCPLQDGHLRVTVRYRYGSDRPALEHADVEVSGPGSASGSGQTDSSGVTMIRNLTPGSYTIRVTRNGTTDGSGSATVVSAQTASAEVLVTPIGTLNGRVVETPGDTPVSGATASIAGRTRPTPTTDAQGGFQFANLEADRYEVRATKTGFQQGTASVDARFRPGGTINVQVSIRIIHATLAIKEIRFAGNHVVEKDTLGNFSSPEWVEGRATQHPVCYTRNTSVRLTAKFNVVRHPGRTETVAVRGRFTYHTTTLEWTANVSVNTSATEVSTPAMTSSAPIPNFVACYDSTDIRWEYNPASTGWAGAGNSRNVIYATLGAPSGTPAYWTLLDISCRAAAGRIDAASVVAGVFVPFVSRSMRRKRDNHLLTYWNPDTTTVTNTRELLQSADGSGQCGSWAHFLLDMYRVHGIAAGDKILIVRGLGSAPGFLVKNWRFNHPPPSSATSFTHARGTECVELPGIPGQSNANPPPAFENHFIVRYAGTYYDPSYGAGPYANPLAWENAAIDGLTQGGRAGYDKALNTTTRLLRFYDLTTSALIP